MRDYLPKSYPLPKNVYYRALYTVRDYDRMAAQRKKALRGDPEAADQLGETEHTLAAIDRALEMIPAEYRRGVVDNVRMQCGYPYIAGTSTWSRQRRRFLFYVALFTRMIGQNDHPGAE